jgi:putative sterol carrier protein
LTYKFPSEEWLNALEVLLNNDERYANIARDWEGDVLFLVEPESGEAGMTFLHMDLWHGKCRNVKYSNTEEGSPPDSKFTLTATIARYKSILGGELDPIQAMVTRRLKVKGNMGYILKNIPVILDFVRCASLVGIDA